MQEIYAIFVGQTEVLLDNNIVVLTNMIRLILPLAMIIIGLTGVLSVTHNVAHAQDSIRAATKYGGSSAAVPDKKQATEGEGWDNVWKNMKTSFSLPLSDFAKKKSVFDGFSGNITFWYPLARLANPDQTSAGGVTGASQGPPPNDMLFYASLYYFPVGYWFVNFSLFQYVSRAEALSWQPDFTYSFGYSDWHPYTFSLIYGNYGGNKFVPNVSKGESVTRFGEGTLSLGWKFPAPQFLENVLAWNPSSGVSHQVNLNLTPNYYDVGTQSLQSWKTSLSLQTRYTVYQYFYLLCTLYYYPNATQQQWWDPDFTYGVGYYDWHSGTISVQYNNYSGNRFPWRTTHENTGRLIDGILTISWNFTL